MIYLLIIAMIAPFGVFFSYRQGVKDGKRMEKDLELAPILKRKKPVKQSAEERKAQVLFENINNYDGTPRNQKEIK